MAVVFASAGFASPALAQDSASDLAQQLSNPVAALISVPIQQNFDFMMAPDGDGWRSTTNIQPVVPISIAEDWNVISRTIMPVIYQEDVSAYGSSEFGLGDVVQSAFISPKTPGASGIIWGVGPVLLVPTATDKALGGKKWGAGPTAVVLKQSGPWTFGGLANHIWSFAGSDNRQDVSATFMQPFITYTTKSATTFGINTETTYDWKSENWSVPINVTVSQLTSLGKQPIQIGVGGKYYAESPIGGANWGARVILTFLFPK